MHERIHEFSGEGLQIRDGSLFCSFCHEFVSKKKSSVGAHVKCKKHTLSKAKHRDSKLGDQSLKEALARRKQQSRPVGETLPLEQQMYRLKVVRVFPHEGVPLSKLAGMRDLREENALLLTTSSHMS